MKNLIVFLMFGLSGCTTVQAVSDRLTGETVRRQNEEKERERVEMERVKNEEMTKQGVYLNSLKKGDEYTDVILNLGAPYRKENQGSLAILYYKFPFWDSPWAIAFNTDARLVYSSPDSDEGERLRKEQKVAEQQEKIDDLERKVRMLESDQSDMQRRQAVQGFQLFQQQQNQQPRQFYQIPTRYNNYNGQGH